MIQQLKCITLTAVAVLALGATPAVAVSSPLANGGFEDGATTASGWAPFGDSGYAVDSAEHHSGTRSIRCSLSADGVAGASSTVTFDQTEPAPIVVSGWSKADNVSGSPDNDYSVYVDLTYMDGTPLWGSTASFDTGTHDWQQEEITITPSKPVKSIAVYALFRHHTGTVWFDDFDAHAVDTSRMFDGQSITPPSPNAVSAIGSWFVRDLSAGSTAVLPIGDVRGLSLAVVDHGDVERAWLVNRTDRERCVTVYYVERRPGAVWWDDIRSSRPIERGLEYGKLTTVSVGATGEMSLYPFGCVTPEPHPNPLLGKEREPEGPHPGALAGRALGVPADLGPRVQRIEYNSRLHLFYVAFDVALKPAGDRFGHDHADLGVVRYDVDPRWGFRDAAARYYGMFPEAYRRRATAEGIWMPFTAPSTVDHVQDFHFAYHEGDNSVATDRAEGILSFRYIEPMTYWMSMAPSDARDYDTALGILKQRASGDKVDESRQALSVLSSGSEGVDGRFNVSFENTPWSNGAVWVLDPNPAVAHGQGTWTSGKVNALAVPALGKSKEPDGVYLDSLESWADTLDYAGRDLDASTSLTFTPKNLRPVIPTWFSVYQDVQSLSVDLHGEGKLLMANSTPWRFPVFGQLLDAMGTETDWNSGGHWGPDSDSNMNLRRTTCYHKPYLLLMNTDFSQWTMADTERYFRRCLFYGIFPSFFSADAATHPYWESPNLYNRDRPLFEKYVPAIGKLSAAGWEPVTQAWTSTPSVWCERYGSRFVTLLNSTQQPARTTLTVDIGKLGLSVKPQRRVVVSDLFTGDLIAEVPARSVVSVPVDVEGGDVRALSITVR